VRRLPEADRRVEELAAETPSYRHLSIARVGASFGPNAKRAPE
jgi:hypothetical protein